MRMRILTVLGFVLGLGGLALIATRPASAEATARTPVVVELFTSEGCSSCPPADREVARIARSQPVSGARVLVVAHHVDYWNRLGWADPYSSAAASERQHRYASLHAGTYTPQAVVDGRAEMIGSHGGAIEAAIADAARRPHATVELALGRPNPAGVEASITIGALPSDASDDAELLVGVVQQRGRSVVPRGENAGQTLSHVGIVRELRSVGAIPKAGAPAKTVRLTLPPTVAAPEGSDFAVVALVQERARRRIHGSALATVTP